VRARARVCVCMCVIEIERVCAKGESEFPSIQRPTCAVGNPPAKFSKKQPPPGAAKPHSWAIVIAEDPAPSLSPPSAPSCYVGACARLASHLPSCRRTCSTSTPASMYLDCRRPPPARGTPAWSSRATVCFCFSLLEYSRSQHPPAASTSHWARGRGLTQVCVSPLERRPVPSERIAQNTDTVAYYYMYTCGVKPAGCSRSGRPPRRKKKCANRKVWANEILAPHGSA
jgi:hypothetical protein